MKKKKKKNEMKKKNYSQNQMPSVDLLDWAVKTYKGICS